jgi:hypothetical protein
MGCKVQGSGEVSMEPDRRIQAVDLVNGARVIPEISEGAARLLAWVFCSAWWTVTLAMAFSRDWPSLIAFVPLGALLTWLAAKPASGRVIAETIHEYWIVARDKPTITVYGTKGNRVISADRVDAGKWVITKKEYDDLRRNAPRAYPDGEPWVPYRLLVATFPVSGAKRAVILSDGLHTEWYRTTNTQNGIEQ